MAGDHGDKPYRDVGPSSHSTRANRSENRVSASGREDEETYLLDPYKQNDARGGRDFGGLRHGERRPLWRRHQGMTFILSAGFDNDGHKP